jgi:BlaI family transcriptional regulator, penicillinase repressor
MPNPKTELTETEWTIIKAVWDAEPCTAPAIHQRVGRQTAWTYSTVRTIMDRMVIKGLLTADRGHHPTVFGSAVTREQAQRGELFYALKHAFNGALTSMVQCLLDSGKFSAAELGDLEALIKARRLGERPPEPKHHPREAEEARARAEARPPKGRQYELAVRNAEHWGSPTAQVRVADDLASQPAGLSLVRSGPVPEEESASGGALDLMAGRGAEGAVAAIARFSDEPQSVTAPGEDGWAVW